MFTNAALKQRCVSVTLATNTMDNVTDIFCKHVYNTYECNVKPIRAKDVGHARFVDLVYISS